MARTKTIHRCSECGSATARWAGRCPSCSAWNTLVEEVERAAVAAPPLIGLADPPRPIAEVDAGAFAPVPTGLGELDRVLGGGLVPGSVSLLGGEPGIGKSTLLLQALASRAARGDRCLLVSAEESAQQVRLRAERLDALDPNLWLFTASCLSQVIAAVAELEPAVLVVDSIQTIIDTDLAGTAGTVTQVRGCAAALIAVAKQRGMATVLVGHVTKDGGLAGPRVLEHLVDSVLSFEGDRHHALRLLRAVKHRFGTTGELGLFEMDGTGLVGLPDPTGLFLGDRQLGAAGSVVVPALEGHRPLLVEVQALTAPTTAANPRRSTQGLDSARVAMLLAVLQRRVGFPLGEADVHASVVGGVRVIEPAADLALALAVASSFTGCALPADLVACAEVGLAGELRQVAHTPKRLAEAARLGFTRAVIAPSAPDPPAGITAVRAADLGEAISLLGLAGSGFGDPESPPHAAGRSRVLGARPERSGFGPRARPSTPPGRPRQAPFRPTGQAFPHEDN